MYESVNHCIRRIGLICSLCAAVTILGGLGCAPLEYETLCLFFDGVPKPVTPKPRPGAANGTGGAMMESDKPFRFETAHRPYEEMQCNTCHSQWSPPQQAGGQATGTRSLIKKAVREGLCQGCHKKVPADLRYVHAPTAVNACLDCHDPHNAPYAALLARPGNETCWHCHEVEDLSLGKHHDAFGPEALRNDPAHQCATCHDPHHGRARFLLKPPKRKVPTAAKLGKRPDKDDRGRPGTGRRK